jgi:hypothetical protein
VDVAAAEGGDVGVAGPASVAVLGVVVIGAGGTAAPFARTEEPGARPAPD